MTGRQRDRAQPGYAPISTGERSDWAANASGATTPVMEEWIDDPDLWLRRAAILGQLKHEDETDADLLFESCRRRAHETDFFIRKAIGWALREYAKTAPGAVKSFAHAHRDELSGLSFREATKHL